MTHGFDIVYVYYPRGLATGGPEALHQLVDSLRRQGREAYLVAVPGTERAPRAQRYAHYDAPRLRAWSIPQAPQLSYRRRRRFC
ncbi:hypothetical protein ACFOEP_12775 [Microbacterium amylolyticum]|uniref:hypothetical protein n=1 Tax=Microbacterium amylolyticum TaxID=936337 RepID=UPI00360675AE